ncbi:hypothetical protein ACWD7F_09040 [Streptomyces sp. NPDC005122]
MASLLAASWSVLNAVDSAVVFQYSRPAAVCGLSGGWSNLSWTVVYTTGPPRRSASAIRHWS